MQGLLRVQQRISPRSYNYFIFFICIVLVTIRFSSKIENVLTWDVFGYYLYLPAKFIYKDVAISDQSWLKGLMQTYEPSSTLYQLVTIENGNSVIKYSSGVAILYAPFFFIAHVLASALGYPADGLSAPYQLAILIGSIVWAIIGIITFSKILRHYFDLFTSSILLVLIIFGTNYLQLTAYDGTVHAHNFLFSFYALIIYFTIKWHDTPGYKYAIFLGIAIGFTILIRPSEATCILIPLLWNVHNKESLNRKFNLVKKHFIQFVMTIACVALTYLPQLFYWKSVTGSYFFYSYVNSGEGFDFMTPYTLKFLFGFRKGWFVYTPLMIVAILGFYNLFRKNPSLFYAIFIFCIVDVYVVSSWTCWWYAGGSFSSRSLMPIYVILAIPLGYFIDGIRSAAKPNRYLVTGLLIVIVLLNLFQTWQWANGIINRDRMTKKYYTAIFGATKLKEEDKKLLLVDRGMDGTFTNEQDYSKKILYENDFKKKEPTDFITDSSGVLPMNGQVPFSPGPDVTYSEITEKDHAWIRASVKVFVPEAYNEELPLLVVTFNHDDIPYKYMAKELKREELKRNAWNNLEIDYLTPEVRSKNDNVKVYVWQRGKGTVFIDDMIVLGFEPLHSSGE
jgi:hypothetical protein